MRRRFLIANVNQVPLRIIHDFEIDRMPNPGEWVNNWEWKYDFADLWRDLVADLKRYVAHLCLRLLQKLGCSVTPGFQEFTDRVEYIDINEDDIASALFHKIYEPARHMLTKGESIIVVGPEEFQELQKQIYGLSPIQFSLRENYFTQRSRDMPYGRRDYQTDIEFCDVPVFCVPDFKGVAVLPKDLFHANKGYSY